MVRQPDHFLWCCRTEEQEGMEREKGVYQHVDDIRHVYRWQTLEDKGMTCMQMKNIVWKKLLLVMLFTKKNCMQMVTFPLSLNQWVFFWFADRLPELICLQWYPHSHLHHRGWLGSRAEVTSDDVECSRLYERLWWCALETPLKVIPSPAK